MKTYKFALKCYFGVMSTALYCNIIYLITVFYTRERGVLLESAAPQILALVGLTKNRFLPKQELYGLYLLRIRIASSLTLVSKTHTKSSYMYYFTSTQPLLIAIITA